MKSLIKNEKENYLTKKKEPNIRKSFQPRKDYKNIGIELLESYSRMHHKI